VGRTAPNCEFAPCPQAKVTRANYTLYGWIAIGPLCPVEPCNSTFDYSVARVNVYDAASKNMVAQASVNPSGYYGVNLEPGDYLVNVTDASGDSFGISRLDYTQPILMAANYSYEVNFSIDTGIR
jgi:hypothetical protein